MKTQSQINMDMQSLNANRLNEPQKKAAVYKVRFLVNCYLGLSLLTIVAAVFLRENAALITPAVWIRGSFASASALLLALFAAQMGRGSRSGYVRMRIIPAVILVAIVVIIVLPGVFPLWMKIEQGVCALFLLGVVVIVNSKHLRSAFARQ